MRQKTSEQESDASDSGIHAFMHGFIVLAGTAAAIMPFPSSELLPVDELLSVLYAANSSHSDESCEQPNIPASVSGERSEEDSARVAEALQNF